MPAVPSLTAATNSEASSSIAEKSPASAASVHFFLRTSQPSETGGERGERGLPVPAPLPLPPPPLPPAPLPPPPKSLSSFPEREQTLTTLPPSTSSGSRAAVTRRVPR